MKKDKNINIDELYEELEELDAKKDSEVDAENYQKLDRDLETYISEIEQITQKTYDNFMKNFS